MDKLKIESDGEYMCGGRRVRVIGPLWLGEDGRSFISERPGARIAPGWWVVTHGAGPYKVHARTLCAMPAVQP